jgi:hypothetical protein
MSAIDSEAESSIGTDYMQALPRMCWQHTQATPHENPRILLTATHHQVKHASIRLGGPMSALH